MNKEKKSTLEEFMKSEDTEELKAENKADTLSLDEPKKKTWLVVLLTVLATLLIAGGAYVAWQSYRADKAIKAEEKIQNPVITETEEPATTTPVSDEKIVYTNAPEGLNMRKEASAEAEILAIIPNGTKLNVLETSGDWYKTEYDSKTGWVAKLYTSETNPLVYKNTTYGFGLTFPETWASYTVVKRAAVDEGVTAYYDVFLNTSDTGVAYPEGKASMFVIAVYTPSQWSIISDTDGPKPGLLKETAKYVFTYSPAQATPDDLASLRTTINDIVKTFIEL